MKNTYGVDEKDLIIRIHDERLNAEQFCKAMRELKRKADLVACGLDDFSEAEIFALKMAGVIRLNISLEGTHTLLPKDVMDILFHPAVMT